MTFTKWELVPFLPNHSFPMVTLKESDAVVTSTIYDNSPRDGIDTVKLNIKSGPLPNAFEARFVDGTSARFSLEGGDECWATFVNRKLEKVLVW